MKKLATLLGGPLGFLVPLWGQVKAARAWLTLVVVATAAAWLYWQYATVARDRGQLEAFAREACATAGAQFAARIDLVPDAKGRLVPVQRKRGELCSLRMLHLAAFERDATKASNEALAGAFRDHNLKSEADASAAARDAATASAAAQKMERAEHEIQGDRVGRDWFDSLNDIAGLRRQAR